MTLEILNIITKKEDKWAWQGRAEVDQKIFNISGTIPALATAGMMKKAIIEDAKRKIKEYLESLKPIVNTMTLTEDAIFKTTI